MDLRQKREDLVVGESWAICYSGFRSGQHPDRGEGAKNPSDAEMLQDLKILSKDGFRLIRLYDSRENSAAILKLIKTHKLPIRVLLGTLQKHCKIISTKTKENHRKTTGKPEETVGKP